jgi:hypothetical protein
MHGKASCGEVAGIDRTVEIEDAGESRHDIQAGIGKRQRKADSLQRTVGHLGGSPLPNEAIGLDRVAVDANAAMVAARKRQSVVGTEIK